jgi:signal transduction histidine kinase
VLPESRLTPNHAKVLVCILGILVFAFDMAVPADLDVAIFYCFVVVLCAWTRSPAFLWTAATIFLTVTIPGLLLSPRPVAGPLSWVDLANRLFGMGALLLVTVFLHLRMKDFRLMEEIIYAKEKAERKLRDSEDQLKLAQAAGHVGSWEWNAADNTYGWSEECYEMFGIDPEEQSFAARWTAAVNHADLVLLHAAMAQSVDSGEMELDYRYEHPMRGTRWIHTKAKAFARDPSAIRWFGICQDVTDRKQIENVLRESRSLLESLVEERTAELHKLSAELLHSQDEERRRIARELHDSFGQYLASMKINLDVLAQRLPATDQQKGDLARLVAECLEILSKCLVETRTLSHLLHPPLLEEAGFASAARWYVEGFAKRSGIEVNLDVGIEFPRLPDAAELALFRALQESLTNVHRYSGASAVDVTITADAEEAVLTVRDYGHGMSPDIVSKFRDHGTGVGVGLSGMRERLKELAGQLELSTGIGGTRISARVPLRASKLQKARAIDAA